MLLESMLDENETDHHDALPAVKTNSRPDLNNGFVLLDASEHLTVSDLGVARE